MHSPIIYLMEKSKYETFINNYPTKEEQQDVINDTILSAEEQFYDSTPESDWATLNTIADSSWHRGTWGIAKIMESKFDQVDTSQSPKQFNLTYKHIFEFQQKQAKNMIELGSRMLEGLDKKHIFSEYAPSLTSEDLLLYMDVRDSFGNQSGDAVFGIISDDEYIEFSKYTGLIQTQKLNQITHDITSLNEDAPQILTEYVLLDFVQGDYHY